MMAVVVVVTAVIPVGRAGGARLTFHVVVGGSYSISTSRGSCSGSNSHSRGRGSSGVGVGDRSDV